jgi:hypothetical protein
MTAWTSEPPREGADIAHLKALEAQATKGHLTARIDQGGASLYARDGRRVLGITFPMGTTHDQDAALVLLIESLRNAAPAMLEVCAAAKEWRAAPTAKEIEAASNRLWAALDALEAHRA